MMPDWQVIQGDCLEVMRGMADGSVDVVVTDPPYLDGDLSYFLPELLRVGRRVVLTPGKLESFNWIRVRAPFWEYAWRSSTRSLGGSACLHIGFEPVLAYHPPLRPLGNDVLDYPLAVDPMANGHPWPKPLALMLKLVSHWTNEGDTVLDPFCGSGTTGVACMQTGRNFIGIEISEEYCNIARKRISAAAAQQRMDL